MHKRVPFDRYILKFADYIVFGFAFYLLRLLYVATVDYGYGKCFEENNFKLNN